MPNRREPVELIVAKGNYHIPKDEIEARKATEVKAPSDNIVAPRYLTAKQRERFDGIAEQLKGIDIMSNLDVDTLAMYIQCFDRYLRYNRMVNKVTAKAMSMEGMKEYSDLLTKYENLRDKTIRQCRMCAGDLGLTITSRCRLIIPKAPQAPPANKFMEGFGTG